MRRGSNALTLLSSNSVTVRNFAARVKRSVISRFRQASDPLLSVIVPIYNVEDYLSDCLHSIVNQTYKKLEVVVIDDGSPDKSLSIAKRFAKQDRRVRIIRQSNAGLGAARNKGVSSARGRYLTFVDSDDTVPIRAFERMIRSLESTGSDLVAGAHERSRDGKRFKPQWSQVVHARERLSVTLEEFPAVLRSFYTHGKVFRTDFWRKNNLHFREGVLFEDQPTITEAYCAAKTIDVLDSVAYTWLIRDDGSSLSQSLYTLENVRARDTATRLTKSVIFKLDSTAVRDTWLWTLLEFHFPGYLRRSLRLGETTFAAIVEMIAAAVSLDDICRVPNVSAQNRVLLHLSLTSGKSAVDDFLLAKGLDIRNFPVEANDTSVISRLPYFGDSVVKVPDRLYVLEPAQLQLSATLKSVTWPTASTLRLTGWAYVLGVPVGESDSISIQLVNEATGERIASRITRTHEPAATVESRHKWISYDLTGFVADVDLSPVGEELHSGSGQLQSWSIEVTVQYGHVTRKGPFSRRAGNSSASQLRTSMIARGLYVQPIWRWASGLHLLMIRRPFGVASIELGSGSNEVVIRRDYGRLTPQELVLRRRGSDEVVNFPVSTHAPDQWIANFDLATSDPEQGAWDAHVITRSGAKRNVHVSASQLETMSSHARRMSARPTHGGQLYLDVHAPLCTVEAFDFNASRQLTLSGILYEKGTSVSFHLANNHVATQPVAASISGQQFDVAITLDSKKWGYSGRGSLPTGYYRLFASVKREIDDVEQEMLVELSAEIINTMPIERHSAVAAARLYRTTTGQVHVHIRPPTTPELESAFGQRQQIERFQTRQVEVVPGIYYQCLRGDAANDNQLALYEWMRSNHPELPQFWGVIDFSIPVPSGATPLLINSREWFTLIGSVKYLCFNHELPKYFTKRSGQIVVQTYHGHPFKTMGVPRWQAFDVAQAEIEENLRARSVWDLLLSQDAIATEMYKVAYPLETKIVEVGHPRNDALVNLTNETRLRARTALSIKENQVAVLYAPTWREYQTDNPWVSKMVDLLDPNDLQKALGDDYVILVRGHAANRRYAANNEADSDESVSPNVLNVTDHPDVNTLIIASDIGLFDYSSIRFDYSVTGKPMIFYVPDRSAYFEKAPALLDYDITTPGPQVHDLAELLNAIRKVAENEAIFADRYSEFKKTFNPLDDGQATARFARAMLDESARMTP
jgi:Putative glycosyl/glycerophosphate transferases involved in teichoic acid biosynthesis TagF/TagB/EpsJ/RodC